MDDNYGPDISGLKMVKATAGAVITLAPSADGDDTDELVAAFDAAKAAGPGSTVHLTEGEFHIGFILVKEFFGTFTGAGIGKTIIIPLPDLPWEEFRDQNLAWVLIKFLRGDVSISNMSFLNLDGEPCPGEDLFAFIGIHDYAINELPDLPEDYKIKAIVDNVEFVSNPGPAGWSPYVVQAAIGCGVDFYWDYNLPYSNVDLSITNCKISDMHMALTNLSMEKGITVFKNNRPVSTFQGLLLYDNIGGSTFISNNEFYTPEGGNSIVVIDDAFGVNVFKPSDGCQYEISGNIFHAQDASEAIIIADYRKVNGKIDNKNPVLVEIKNNLFDLQ